LLIATLNDLLNQIAALMPDTIASAFC